MMCFEFCASETSKVETAENVVLFAQLFKDSLHLLLFKRRLLDCENNQFSKNKVFEEFLCSSNEHFINFFKLFFFCLIRLNIKRAGA